MEQYDQAIDSTNTALNSAGSGYRENAEYLKSFEARINMVKNSWTEAIIAMRDTGLGDAMILGLQTGLEFMQFLTKLIDTVGVFPVVIGGASLALGLFSDKFRGLALAMGTGIVDRLTSLPSTFRKVGDSSKAASVEIDNMSRVAKNSSAQVGILNKSLKGLGSFAMASLPVLGIMLATSALTHLIGKAQEAKQAERELQEHTKQMAESFSSNQDEIRKLADEYKNLESVIKSGDYSDTQLDRYKEVQNELAQLMPALVSGETQFGDKILISSEHMERRLRLAEQEYEVMKKKADLDRQEETQEAFKSAEKSFENNVSSLDTLFDKFNENMKTWSLDGVTGTINSVQDLNKIMDELVQKVENGTASWRDEEALNFLNRLNKDYEKLTINVESSAALLRSKAEESVNAMMSVNDSYVEGTKSALTGFLSYVGDTTRYGADSVSQVFAAIQKGLGDDATLQAALARHSQAIQSYVQAIEKGLSGKELDNYKKAVESATDDINKRFLSVAKDSGIVGDAYNQLQADVSNASSDITADLIDWEKASQNTGMSVNELMAMHNTMEDQLANGEGFDSAISGAEEYKTKLEELIAKYEELTAAGNHAQATELLMGDIYKEVANEISPLNKLLEDMAEGKRISAHEAIQLIAKEKDLADAIRVENGVVKVNQDAVLKLRDSKMTAYKDMIKAKQQDLEAQKITVAQKLKYYKLDLEGIKTVADAQNQMYSQMAKRQSAAIAQRGLAGAVTGVIGTVRDMQSVMNIGKIAEAQSQLDSLLNLTSTGLSTVGTSLEKTSSAAKSASDKTNKATESSIYVSDKYKQALEKINLELEKQNAIKSKFPKHSKEYQNAIKTEISLLEQQSRLMKDQANTLNRQIRSGKVPQTGIITTSSNTSSASLSNASRAVADYYLKNFRQTSQFGDTAGRSSPHRGIDFANGRQGDLVKALKGGKVVTATYSPSAGNWVVIQQDDGTVAKYMHLQNGLNVRAGQYVQAGQSLGRVGNTGHSTGAHLHLQIEKNGVAINPLSYMAGIPSTTGSSSTSKAQSDASKQIAQQAQAVDQARTEALRIEQEMLSIQETIQQRRMELIESQVEGYRYQAEQLNGIIALEEYNLSKYEETDTQYRNRLSNIAKHKKEQSSYYKQSINYMERELKSNKALNAAQKHELRVRIADAKQEYLSLLSTIDDVNRQIKDSLNAVADEVIEAYKQAYEKQREIMLENNANEMKILEDSHRRKLDMLDEEMSAYEKLIQAKLKSIDKEVDEENYAERLADLQKERMELQRQIDIFSMDSSTEGRRRTADLEKQLADKDKEITKFTTDRERQLRKESLNQQLDDKREQIEEERKLEDEKYQNQKEVLEIDKENIEKHYENLLEGERAFAKMREQILAGNTKKMQDELKKFSTEVSKNMRVIGKSIGENVIDQIGTAVGMLQGVNKNYVTLTGQSSTPKNIAKFDTGGYTGNFSGGKLGVLHEKELILEKGDTKNVLNAVSLLKGLNLSKLTKGFTSGASNTNNNQTIHIAKMEINEVNNAKDLFKDMNETLRDLGVQFPR